MSYENTDSYKDGVDESMEKIFAAVITGDIDRDNPILQSKIDAYKTCMPKFQAKFAYNIFTDEFAFFYSIIKKLKVKTFTKNQLNSLIDQNVNEILNSPYINMSKWENVYDDRVATDEEKIEAFRMELNDAMYRLSNTLVTVDEFESACEIYINWYKDKLMLDTTQAMALIMSSDGYDERQTRGRRKHYQGREDAQKYYNEKMSIIRSLEEEDSVKSTVVDEEYYRQDMEKEKMGDEDALIDFGIKEIDEVVGVLRRSNMIEFLGPPKGGKTTMANFLVERCLEAGLNVAVWVLDGTAEEWIALTTAIMLRKSEVNPIVVDKKRIIDRRYENELEAQAVRTAKYEMATNKNRGRLSFIHGTAYVEDFVDELQAHYDNDNPFDVLVIDSPVNMFSRYGKSKTETISEGFMKIKDYVSNKMKRKALAIVTAQLKQSVIDYIRKNPNETIDVTAGGESAETIRTPDEVIGLFSTKNERSLGQMKIYSVASRHSGNFEDFYVGCQLGCGYFYSKPELNE